MAAYNFARPLKTLSGLTPYEYIAKIWTSEPDRFIVNPIYQMPGLTPASKPQSALATPAPARLLFPDSTLGQTRAGQADEASLFAAPTLVSSARTPQVLATPRQVCYVGAMMKLLVPGEPAPWFRAPVLGGNDRYAFDTVAGRWVVMLLLGSAGHEKAQESLQLLAAHRNLFDDERACFFGVTIDPTDAANRRVRQALPGMRWILDYDHTVSKRFGAVAAQENALSYLPHWLLLDPMLRVRSRGSLSEGAKIITELGHCIERPPEAPVAPVLIVPDVLSLDLCKSLIDSYEFNGGSDSGFMLEENGATTQKIDYAHKRRADYTITDERVLAVLKRRIATVLRPMIQRAFQFDATRIERFIVACYDGADGGHFRAHRDNTTKGTAHRKFACTINLNADQYEGGDLRFPEFGPRAYRAPTGGAVVFSCSLLHEAGKVVSGRRYAFLPFLYDDEGALTRERNLEFVSPELRNYKSGLSC